MVGVRGVARAFATTGAALLCLGCSAAAVVFDLPEGEPEVDTAQDASAVAGLTYVDTVRITPPIELIAQPESVLAALPVDAAGGVDWSEAVRSGVIDPIPNAPGHEPPKSEAFGFDFYFGDFETYFPHSSHVAWAACESCHPAIYRSRDVKTSMKALSEGESCGTCHGTVAFGLDRCERCHPQATMPEGRVKATLANDLVFTRDTTTDNARDMTSLAPSIFPHWTHRLRYQCSACHDSLFRMEAGGTTILMDEMQMGGNCGTCHNSESAFGVMQCGDCHVEPPEPVVAPDSVEESPPPEDGPSPADPAERPEEGSG